MLSFLAVNTDNVLKALDIFWKGMLGIFIVMAVIFLLIVVLNFLTNNPKKTMMELKQKILHKKDKQSENGVEAEHLDEVEN